MRRALLLLSFAVILLVAVAHVYRDPRVRDLFRSVPKAGSSKGLPARTATHSAPEPPAPAARAPAATTVSKKGAPPEERNVVSAAANRIPNETVGRVLLQILAAKGLSRGISLEVSDGSIKVLGEVDSNDKRQAIISLIEKGRESRRLDAAGLVVQR
jgi:hypothetical protein